MERKITSLKMKNRYKNKLRVHNQEILELSPYNPFIFIIGAKELRKLYQRGDRVLEIGCGEGNSALPFLTSTDIKLDLLDVSNEMIGSARKRLKDFRKQTAFIREDACAYLSKSKPYKFIFSAWTIHNFRQQDKKRLFKAIYDNLENGGYFLLLDKVYPVKSGKTLFDNQNRRYERYLDKKVAKLIIDHEIADMSDVYRMDEKTTLALLKQIGFEAKVVDRIERDVLLIAKKK